jgi:hypothetical protein
MMLHNNWNIELRPVFHQFSDVDAIPVIDELKITPNN